MQSSNAERQLTIPDYFAGMAGGTLLSTAGAGVLPGICAAGLASTGAVGVLTEAPSKTLPDEDGVRLPK